ncbi:glycerophosphodiester phosphodiesterase [bacterium]|nr:glycerophosphodiester phosphodiesterase [bacterium]NBX98145.1 glycerophosphodiester phosphodiesterase [bacterium]NDC94851.1 glycerophosphodiester phosphodiesterase [bacterium]NDD83366.1 glycerophosphodiester phosphodiesterase [bacterium]NDG28944.1 glycerophosphodiester phosphodiesterase [bacterium]
MSLVSHRGAAGLAHENSWKAISLAKKYNPIFIEVDVHRTSDGVFVMYHGDIKQTYNGNDRPETYDQLKKEIPSLLTLEELLTKDDQGVPFMFDIKCADSVYDLITFLRIHSLPKGSGFTTPHESSLDALKKAFPDSITLISQKYQAGPIRAIELARDRGFSGISLNKWWLGPLPYLMCKFYKKQIMVYTINHKLWMRFAQKLYPNIMLCTNYPDIYRSVYSQDDKRIYSKTNVKI